MSASTVFGAAVARSPLHSLKLSPIARSLRGVFQRRRPGVRQVWRTGEKFAPRHSDKLISDQQL